MAVVEEEVYDCIDDYDSIPENYDAQLMAGRDHFNTNRPLPVIPHDTCKQNYLNTSRCKSILKEKLPRRMCVTTQVGFTIIALPVLVVVEFFAVNRTKGELTKESNETNGEC